MKSFALRTAAEPDPLKDFGEEAVPLATDSAPRRTALAVLAVLAVGIASIPYALIRYSNAPALGTLTVDSTPAGRRLVVDGVPRGATPQTVALPPGDHLVVIGEGPGTITLPVTTRSGEQLRQSVVFETTVVSDSPAVAPVTAVAESAKRASAVIPAPSGAGWLAVAGAISVRILENGELLGSSDTPRVMLPAGAHTLELRNDDLGFRDVRKVHIAAGKTVALSLTLPRSVLHVNAVPWAEVSIDGTRAGETPIGNYRLPIGTHHVVFSHPQFGERRQSVVVTAAAPARVSVDFTK